MKTIAARALQAAPLFLFLLLWQAASVFYPDATFFIGSPLGIADVIVAMLDSDRSAILAWSAGADPAAAAREGLVLNMAVTGGEALTGFVIGNLLGAAVGMVLGVDHRVAFIARPYFVALGAVPVFALAPLTILWFGIGITAKVGLAALATFFIASAQAFKAIEEIDPLYSRRLKLMGARRWVVFRRLLLPASMVWIVASLRLTIGAALLGAFLGELIASDHGLGRLIMRASGLYDTSRVMTGVLAIIVIAMFFDYAVSKMEKRLIRWER